MQIFDTLTITTLFFIVLIQFFNKSNKKRWVILPLFLAVIFALIQLSIEGSRWQLIPIYGLLCFYILQNISRFFRKKIITKSTKRSVFLRVSGNSFSTLLIFSSVMFSYLFPVFELPQPTGPFAVGTTEFHLIDTSRDETYTSDLDDNRELMVRAWYPAVYNESAITTPYWRQASVRSAELAKNAGMPSFLLSHLGRVETHSEWDAPVSNKQKDYPVLIFSHGFNQGWASQNTHLMESLASHGYIIFSIDHAYVGMASIYPDGRLASFKKAVFKGFAQPPSAELMAAFEKLKLETNWQKQIKLLKHANAMFPEATMLAMGEALQIWAADQRFVLSQIDKLQLGESLIPTINMVDFKGRLNTEQLGFFGMSFGGSTSLQNCVKEPRCKAGINLDGFMAEQVQLPPLKRPFMFLNSEHNRFFNAMYSIAENDVYGVTVKGSTHLNYLDFSIMSPMYKMMGILGEIEGVKMLTITDDYVRSFFDHYLKNKKSPLLDGNTNKYPEVMFKKKLAKQE